MDSQLTPEQKAFVLRAMESGRLRSEEDAVKEAPALWEERERQRAEFLLILQESRASLARGEGRAITQESMRQLAAEVKERRPRSSARRSDSRELMAHRLSPSAEADLDDIWLHVAKSSGVLDVANRLIDSITE